MKRIPRRTLLRGAILGGTVAVGLPWLEAMDPKPARAQEKAPKRVLFWFTANGTRQDIWSPPGNMDLSGHPLHASLAPYASKLMFLDGVDQQIANESIGDGHQTGMACLLTNEAILPGTLFCEGECAEGNQKYVGWGGGISVDQHIANEIAKSTTTKFKSLELGVQVKGASVWSRMCYAGPDSPIPPREDPGQNFNDFFSDLNADPFAVDVLRRKRQSVLDAVMSDYKSFSGKLGKEDKMRLDKHLEAIRQVEERLDSTGVFGAECAVPTIDQPGEGYQQNDNYPITGRAQMDMLAMAMACDLTRVGSLQWSTSVSNVQMNWLDLELGGGHHDLSHYGDEDQASQNDLEKINRWYSEQFAYFLGKLDEIEEGDSTLLDNSVVVWVNELGKGNSHTRNDIPFLLAGGCQGYFDTGRHLEFDGEPHGKLLVSLCDAMGFPTDTFGVPQHSQGVLPGLKKT